MIRALVIGLGLLMGTTATAAPDNALTRGFDDCFGAVTSGNGLFTLSAYDMRPQDDGADGARLFQGILKSDLGDLAVQAIIRDGLLAECALGGDAATIAFATAEDSVKVWFDWLDSTGLGQILEAKSPDIARVMCLPDLDEMALHVSATKQGSEPNGLRFAVTVTDPGNFKQCG